MQLRQDFETDQEYLPNLSMYSPKCHNPLFMPALMDPVFSQWSDKGLISIKDLYINKEFASFAQSHLDIFQGPADQVTTQLF